MSALKTNLDDLQRIAKERTVKTQTIEYDLETMVKKIDKNIIKLNPEYQRKHRWKIENSSRLIESLILNIPVPFIYISQDIDVDEEVEDDVSRYSVIDGQQRLTAIHDFFKCKYPLTDLEVLEQLNGCLYSDLPPFLIRRLEERSIRCLRIDSTVDQQVKYDIFERLNSGSVKLEPQELRNATCRGPFKKLLKKLAKHPSFVELAELKPLSSRVKKMEDEELVLRYFALTYNDGYMDYKGGFKKFLTSKMVEFNKLPEDTLKGFEKNFVSVMDKIKNEFPVMPFAKYRKLDDENLEIMSQVNVSVFDAIVSLFNKAVLGNKDISQLNILSLFLDDDFFMSCEGSTNDAKKIQTRINKAIELL
ncbi:MAG: hypothetical protein CML20_03035 [Rheinheimera sp.]|nr:hypothetical protein [Rheinheimera sp.]|tara:strand:- start:35885 stop:36970 length:1086 start_codon:yes stop_codon:yes gene_type:complete